MDCPECKKPMKIIAANLAENRDYVCMDCLTTVPADSHRLIPSTPLLIPKWFEPTTT